MTAMQGNLAEIVSGYQTVITHFTSSGGDVDLMLKSDPRRFYVQFIPITGTALMPLVLPKEWPQVLGAGLQTPGPLEYRFRDCPAVVTGEWYSRGAVGQFILIVEQLYVRG